MEDRLARWLSNLTNGTRVRPLTHRTLDGAAPYWAAIVAEVLHRLRPDMPAPPANMPASWWWLQSLPAERPWRDIPVPPADLRLVPPAGAPVDVWSCGWDVAPARATLLLARPPVDADGEWQLATCDGQLIARIDRRGGHADVSVGEEAFTLRRGGRRLPVISWRSVPAALAARAVVEPSVAVPVADADGPCVVAATAPGALAVHRAAVPALARALADVAPGTPWAVLARALAALPDEWERATLPLGGACAAAAADMGGAVRSLSLNRGPNGVWYVGIDTPDFDQPRAPNALVGGDLVRLFARAVQRAATDRGNPVTRDGIRRFESAYGHLDLVGMAWGGPSWYEAGALVADRSLVEALDRGEVVILQGDRLRLTVGAGVAVLDAGECGPYVLAARRPAALLPVLAHRSSCQIRVPEEQWEALRALGIEGSASLPSREEEWRISRSRERYLALALAGERPCPPILLPDGEVRWSWRPVCPREGV